MDREGGVKGDGFVNGGWLPDDRRGKNMDALMHITGIKCAFILCIYHFVMMFVCFFLTKIGIQHYVNWQELSHRI